MAKRIDKLFTIEVYDTILTDDDVWKRARRGSRAKRQFLDFDGRPTNAADLIGVYASERAVKTTIRRWFNPKDDDRFSLAKPTIVVFVRR